MPALRPALLAACLALPPAFAAAQDAVIAAEDPESLFSDDDPVLDANKRAALHIMRELLQCGQWDRAGEWITDRYIQHNPQAASGLDGVVTFFTEVLGQPRTDECGPLQAPVVAVMAEDDLVTVLVRRDLTDDRGAAYTTTWFDTWRFVDGRADEHWDPQTR